MPPGASRSRRALAPRTGTAYVGTIGPAPSGTNLARTIARARIAEAKSAWLGVLLVGDTGFEPVTSSVSRKRAPTAPIARGGDGIEPVYTDLQSRPRHPSWSHRAGSSRRAASQRGLQCGRPLLVGLGEPQIWLGVSSKSRSTPRNGWPAKIASRSCCRTSAGSRSCALALPRSRASSLCICRHTRSYTPGSSGPSCREQPERHGGHWDR